MKTKNFEWTIIGVVVILFIVTVSYGVISKTLNSDSPTPATGSFEPGDTGTTESSSLVLIEEYSDFQCPYCSRVIPTINQIKQEYGGDVEIVFKHYPLPFHSDAKIAAEASECARDQGKFWEYHDLLFANQGKLKIPNLKDYASELGLDTKNFAKCLDAGEKTAIVEKDFNGGKSRGVTGTPTFFINGQKVVGAQPYETFKEVIDIMIEVTKGG
ncbi:MAG: thioredoxin domain-containing protein [Methanobacteriota archaeon]